MKSETINLYGEDLDVYYQITEGIISSDKDVPNDEDELEILQIKLNGQDISSEIGHEEVEEIEQLLVDKILN
jgi:hypothetical protein